VKKVDLHIHSCFSSDGEVDPDEIVNTLKYKGFYALSITDHDSMEAYPSVLESGNREGIEIIEGVELTTGYKGREVHLLAYFLDHRKAGTLIEKISATRMELTRKRLEKLSALGMEISFDEVMAKSHGRPPTGPIIAEIAINKYSLKKYLREKDPVRSFYYDYFLPGKPAFVERVYIPIKEAISMVLELKAVPVLAHPGAYIPFTEEEIEDLKESGLIGIEVRNSYHSKKQVDFYGELALKFSLVPTCGSDFHGRRKPHIALGSVYCDYDIVEQLKRRRDGL